MIATNDKTNYDAIYKKSNSDFIISINMSMRMLTLKFIKFIFDFANNDYNALKFYNITFDDSDYIKYNLKVIAPIINEYHNNIKINMAKGFFRPIISEVKK